MPSMNSVALWSLVGPLDVEAIHLLDVEPDELLGDLGFQCGLPCWRG